MIKKIFYLIILIFIYNCNNNKNKTLKSLNNEQMTRKSLSLNFYLEFDETSKDCSTSLIEIKILKRKITVSKKYYGFKVPENEFFEKSIDLEIENKIIKYIEKEKLNFNIKEKQKKDGIGISGYLKFEILSPQYSKIFIEGKTNIWGNSDYVVNEWGEKYVETRTNIENIEYFIKAENFIKFIEELIT